MITGKVTRVDCIACPGYDGGDLALERSGISEFDSVPSDRLGCTVDPYVP